MIYEILFRFKTDGTLRGSHARDWDGLAAGDARPLTGEDIDNLDTLINEGSLARIAELEAALATQAEAHAAAIAELTGAPRPGSVTARQIRIALIESGIDLDAIPLILAGDPEALVNWEYADTILRDHPLVASLGTALGMSDVQIDALFALAAGK